jgi:hypothetical protein
MKKCPKCQTTHEKNGTYCSRKCANSRNFSKESRDRKSVAQRNYFKSLPSVEFEKRLKALRTKEANEKKKKSLLEKSNSRSWDEIGWDSKRRRVIEEQKSKCFICNLSEWNNTSLTLEIDHIDGNNRNNSRENLRGLCPNCHSTTHTWRGRNKPSKNGQKVSDEDLLTLLTSESNIRSALKKAELAAKGNNYKRAKQLLFETENLQ